jgi:CubicO group peptidase (beta-lactamase class C family)
MISSRKRALCVLSLAVASSTSAIAQPRDSHLVADSIDDAAMSAMRVEHIPGLAVVVSDRGVVTVRSYGFSDLKTKTPVTPDTQFQIGSITKQFTAAAILQLVEGGQLSLDDRLGRFLPSYVQGRGVTIRELLGQTSGIPDYLEGDVTESSTHRVGFDAILARVDHKPLDFAPGTFWAYSNTNYLILGRIIELVSHENYESYLREHVLEPAGLTHTGFMQESPRSDGYVGGASGAVPASPLDASWAGAAGELVSTASDILTWDKALLSGAIISPADVALMREDGRLASGEDTGYGFGWFVDRDGSRERIWHGGNTWGFASSNVTYPQDGVTIVVLANLNTADTKSIASRIIAAVYPVPPSRANAPAAIAKQEPSMLDNAAASRAYVASVTAMRGLAIPPFATYRSVWTSVGSGFQIYQDDKAVVAAIGVGGDFKKQQIYDVSYRSNDRTIALTNDERQRAVGRAETMLDPTWAGAYDLVRFGVDRNVPVAATPQPSLLSTGDAQLSTISTVTAIAPAFYRVQYAGTVICPAGEPGMRLKLTAIGDPNAHPLTEVTIDTSNRLFCDMRFNLRPSGVAGVTGTYEIHFSAAGSYWLVSDGIADLAVRFFGISAKHVVLHWENDDVSPSSDLSEAAFTPPTRSAGPSRQ